MFLFCLCPTEQLSFQVCYILFWQIHLIYCKNLADITVKNRQRPEIFGYHGFEESKVRNGNQSNGNKRIKESQWTEKRKRKRRETKASKAITVK